MNNEKKKKYCAGCRNNIYNNGGPHEHTNKCWSLDEAEIVKKKEVHVSQQPPWDNCKIKKVPNCYSKSKHVYIDPNRKR